MSSPRFLPVPGSFAVARIDPEASLQYLQDPQALEAAARLVFLEYIVFIPGGRAPLLPGVQFRQEEIEFVHQGLPAGVPEHGITSSMSLAILPATSHPTDRVPLAPIGDFPWDNCYLSPFLSTVVRTPTVLSADPVLSRLGITERVRHNRVFSRDVEAYREALSQQQRDPEEHRVPRPEASDTVHDLDAEEAANDIGLVRSAHDSVDDLIRFVLTPREVPDDMITVHFTQDLSRIRRLNDPRGFFEEVDAISRIAAESVARRKRAVEEDSHRLDELTAAYLAESSRNNPAGTKLRQPALTALRRWIRGIFNSRR
ncbi:hypothetical protein MKEN_00622800 [Mycena kentingensis (nom. inval.)]|nr:hypothetical protein MKEN_00622800 [Mycena kentingensis (nom. inval.)]